MWWLPRVELRSAATNMLPIFPSPRKQNILSSPVPGGSRVCKKAHLFCIFMATARLRIISQCAYMCAHFTPLHSLAIMCAFIMPTQGKTRSDVTQKKDGEGQLVMAMLALFLRNGGPTRGILLSTVVLSIGMGPMPAIIDVWVQNSSCSSFSPSSSSSSSSSSRSTPITPQAIHYKGETCTPLNQKLYIL